MTTMVHPTNLMRRLFRAVRYPYPRRPAWEGHAQRARALGFERPTLFLSFDCDTDEDARALREIHHMLSSLGITYTLAVPGTQLRRTPEVYRSLAVAGLEFINHGQAPHAVRHQGRYVSSTFYRELTPEEVREDIRQGHESVLAVTGTAPQGFRAPHFGLFQREKELAIVYAAARELGYTYCSTTMPSTALERGPAFAQEGLLEVPLCGTARIPDKIFDSWSFLDGTSPPRLSPEYARLGIETLDFFHHQDMPALLSWYVDPNHVAGQAAFRTLMEHVARRGVPSLTARQVLARCSRPAEETD